MGERTDQIERHIHETRNELGGNIDELQQKVKSSFDWRVQFQQRPWALIGAAFGGGLLVSMLIPKGRSSSRGSYRSRQFERGTKQSQQPEYGGEGRPQDFSEKTSNTWDNVRSALLTAGIGRLASFVEEIIPGFQDQFRRKQSDRGQMERRRSWRHNGPEQNSESRPAWRPPAGGETDFGPQA